MKIKEQLKNLNQKDIYSLMLFALYKVKDIPEYSSISELAFILDKENLLKLCQYFGGINLKIPTLDELENLIYALVLYEYVDLQNIDFNDALKYLGTQNSKTKEIKELYKNLRCVLENYNFETRGNQNE